MVKKSLAIVLFIVVTIGFLYGFITYNKGLTDMLGKKIDPSAVVLPENTSEPEEQETEAPETEESDSEEPESDEPDPDEPLEEPDETSELVVIPYIIGLHKEDAVKALEENNLVAEIHLEYIDGVEKDYVFYQRPPRNQEVPEGTTVSFSVSRGPYGSSAKEEKVIVPSLTGKSQAQAENALKDVNLLMKVKEAYSSQVAKGNVITQDTAAGKEVVEGNTVTVTVSSGKEPVQQVVVPNVVGMTRSAAESLLESKGLKAAASSVDSDKPVGEIVKQSTASGVSVSPGTSITISVSKGPQPTIPPEEPTEPVEPTDPPDPGESTDPEETPPEEPADPEVPSEPVESESN